ncbi:hypothetical protein BH24ACT23_BH24ACT23_01820 [soil metagenome]
MIGTLVVAVLILVASLAVGRALMMALGWKRPDWVGGAVGFAALVVVAPFAVRLPGRGLTAAILIALLTVACIVATRRSVPPGPVAGEPRRGGHLVALVVTVAVLAAACLPFLFNEETGVLGEGIYTNDQAAQLYWADWLANGYGPQPSAVAFGYPVGPQALAAAASEGTGVRLLDAFNGMLIAIPALTALAALAVLSPLGAWRRGLVAALAGLPYLGASFLAQSGFKETAMALFVLALAAVLHVARPAFRPDRATGQPTERDAIPSRAAIGVVAILAVAAVFTFSIPGGVWFGIAVPAWAALLWGAGELSLERLRGDLARHRRLLLGGGLLLLVLGGIALAASSDFIGRIGDVQDSRGRLDSPVFPGEALGIWPEGDFRIVRGLVDGAVPATGFAALCAALASLALIRAREWGLLAVLGSAALVYAIARPVAEIHVEAKALAVLAPIVTLVTARWLLSPGKGGAARMRQVAGVAFAALAAGSTFLALREAPVGFDDRGESLHDLAARIDGESVAFLGVDRFGGYWLRGTLVESPGGYVPPDVEARPEKTWQQGLAMDFDTLSPSKLDNYDWAVTTAAAYASTPPPSFSEAAREGDYVLWQRTAATPKTRVLNEGGEPGRINDCAQSGAEPATVLAEPIRIEPEDWSPSFAFDAPGTVAATISPEAQGYGISLQYHSQVPLTVRVGGEEVARLPASLEGMYATSPGRGAFWPAGEIQAAGREVEVTVEADQPSGLQNLLGVERRVWIGALALTADTEPRIERLADTCGDYVDHFEPIR